MDLEIGWIRYLGRYGNSLRLTIPKEICNALGYGKGDKMKILVKDGVMHISKIKIIAGGDYHGEK